jgi:PAC2 family protein
MVVVGLCWGSVPARVRIVAYPSQMPLYTLDDPGDLIAPTVVAAFDGWVDAGSAATTALDKVAEGGAVIARFDADRLFDYRARRPPLEIVDGRLTELTWHELVIRRVRLGERDVLVLAGPEPDYQWQAFCGAIVEVCRGLGVAEWISVGAIPAAVPHTRAVPILGTEAAPGLLRGDVMAGPAGTLRVPSALVSALEFEVSTAGIPALGYFAQVPHYVSGPYATAALELLRAIGTHLGTEIPARDLDDEARELRTRLDEATAADETTRTYVERLEGMYDEQRLATGDDLISDIERFLREQGGPGRDRGTTRT